jgi:CubicO group peptidase (beta-lactamase class C family)
MRADRRGIDDFPASWVESGEVTAAFAVVATAERTLWSAGAGVVGEPPPSATSLFDAASLTKPWIATLALALDAAGLLALKTRLGEVWPDCAEPLARRPLGDLLRHRAGLAPWTPLYRRCRSRAAVERLLVSGALVGGRSGYSDLDYVLWGLAAERALETDLATLLRRRVLAPLGVRRAGASPGDRADVVRCHCDNAVEVELAAAQGIRVRRRGGPPRGVPQDGNARFLGGLCGHAGLFVDAESLLVLGREWLAALGGDGRVLQAERVRGALAGTGEYGLGWARRRARGSAGPALSPGAFGHVGFTGTSLWIDPERGALFVLLAHRRRAAGKLNAARRRYHGMAAALADAMVE